MLEIIIGAVVIFAILGAIFGGLGSAADGDNPIEGAAGGAFFGAVAGLQQGCGCAFTLLIAGLVFAVGKWILGG